MPRFPVVLIFLLPLTIGAQAGGISRLEPSMPPPQIACLKAIAIAEAAHGIPTGFLLAIARLESGRFDARTGLTQPWPWTIDVAGKGRFLETAEAAAAAVTAERAQGIQSVDVGCMQVNLQHHPDAFTSVSEAFDPMINADYAARFLVDLHRESGDWMLASGLYHSRTESLAGPYRAAVAFRLPGASIPRLAAAIVTQSPFDALAIAWAATVTRHDAHRDGRLHLWPKSTAPRLPIGVRTAMN